MLQQITIDPTAPHQDLVTVLDGVSYIMQLRYNARSNRYYLNLILESTLTDVVDGLKLSPSVPLLYRYKADTNCPPGELLVIIQNGTNDASPGLGELGPGLRCGLFYAPAADIAAGTSL